MLHNEHSLFEQVILRVSEDTGIEASIIEKDYYVTLFLHRIVTQLPNIIFKGGTSLSKCYKLINRFSEDIDLNIETETHPTEGQRKKLKEVIMLYYWQEMNATEIAQALGLAQSTVSNRLKRARDLLRKVLERRGTHE